MRRSKKTNRLLQTVQQQGPGAQTLAGVGVDIVEIERMEKAIARTPRIVQRIFSDGERAYAQKKSHPAVHYALFFAAKEAVLKALGTGFAGMSYTDVEVSHDRYGKPLAVLHGHAQEVAHEQKVIEVQLSLSYTHQVGVASAVAIKAEHRPRRESRVDPRDDLMRQFKEMRDLLDDMDTRLRQLDEQETPPEPADSIQLQAMLELSDEEPKPLADARGEDVPYETPGPSRNLNPGQ